MSMDMAELDDGPAPPSEEIAAETPMSVRVPMMCRYYRKRQGKTLAQMATKLGTTPQTVQRLETGGMTMSLEWLDKFMEALELPPEALFVPGPRSAIFAEAEKQIRAEVSQKLRHFADNLDRGNI